MDILDPQPTSPLEEPSRTLDLHFGEIVTLDACLRNYEELLVDASSIRPLDKMIMPIKGLLLKLGSAFVETIDNQQEIDISVPITFTESELWAMRQNVGVAVQYKGVPIGLELKRKIYQALVEIHSVPEEFDIEDLVGVNNTVI